jgi:hypothetical protein
MKFFAHFSWLSVFMEVNEISFRSWLTRLRTRSDCHFLEHFLLYASHVLTHNLEKSRDTSPENADRRKGIIDRQSKPGHHAAKYNHST